jgi:lysyl-tRNA synthetase class 2
VGLVRRLTSPLLLAWATAAVGVVAVVSAATPEMADRSRVVRGLLSQSVPSVARTLTLAFGLGLLWLARGLARRKRRAWQLAVVLVVATAITHLVKGLDFEEAAGSVLLVGALLYARREFVAPGDPEAIRPLLQVALALAVVVPISALHVFGTAAYSDRVDDAILIVIGALALRALAIWLRPVAERARNVPADRRRAEKLVREHGSDSLAYFALRRDKTTFFSASGRSFLAYRVIGGTAIVAGDPIGDPRERGELVGEFRRVAHTKGWRVAIAGAAGEALPDYAALGFKSLYLGDEAFVDPQRFSLEGRPIRKVRQSVSRLQKAGYRFEMARPDEIGDELRRELRSVSEEWRGKWPERGFTMAMDALFAYPDALIAIARDATGAVGGFLQLVPAPACRGFSLASMRRRRETPNGLIEFLIVRTIEWARAHDVSEVALNFAAFAEYLRADRGLLRALLLRLDRLFQLERLHSFNRKFFPSWRRRYFCVERWSDLPVAGLAYLHAESMLTPPGPWAKSLDLAAR